MKKLFLLLSLLPTLVFAQDTLFVKGDCVFPESLPERTKSWSIYGDLGASMHQYVHMSAFDPEFEAARLEVLQTIHPGVWIQSPWANDPESQVITLHGNLGLSLYHNNWRYSLETGFSAARQQYYHYTSADLYLLAGYNFLHSDNHELFLEGGVGAYATFNKFTYSWTGVDGRTLEPIPGEEFSIDLGSHNSVQPSVMGKLTYNYNLSGNFWLGLYAQYDYNINPKWFAPRYEANAGLQLRYTKSNRPKTHRERVYVDELPICSPDTYYITYHDTITVESVREVVREVPISVDDTLGIRLLFEYNSDKLTDIAKARITKALEFYPNEMVLVATSSPSGGLDYNTKLSLRRAKSVESYIHQISPNTKITTISIPRAAEEAPEARAVYLRDSLIDIEDGVSVLLIEDR